MKKQVDASSYTTSRDTTPVLDAVVIADHVEAHRPRDDRVPGPGRRGELDADVSKDCVVPVGQDVKQVFQELPRRLAVRVLDQACHRNARVRSMAAKRQGLPSDGRSSGDVELKDPYRVPLEPLSLGLVAVHVRQPRNAVSLQASMQGRAREMRMHRLQGVEAVVQREHRLPAKRDNDGFFLFAKTRRGQLSRTRLPVLDRLPLPPRRDGLWIDRQLSAQLRGRSSRSLYCRSNGVHGRGAARTVSSHDAFVHSLERITP